MSLKRSYQNETGMILMKEDEIVGYVYNRNRGDALPAAFSMVDELVAFVKMVDQWSPDGNDPDGILQQEAHLLVQQLDWTQEEIAKNR